MDEKKEKEALRLRAAGDRRRADGLKALATAYVMRAEINEELARYPDANMTLRCKELQELCLSTVMI